MENIKIQNALLEMPEAITGNSKMLVCHRGNGEIFRLFWPHIEYGQHLGHFWPGIRVAYPEWQGFTKWFHLNIWGNSQRYIEDTNILETTLDSLSHRLKVIQSDFILPDSDILVRHYEIINEGGKSEKITFFVYCSFNIEESAVQDGAYIDFSNNSLVFFRRNIYLALAGTGYPLAGYQCGRRGTSSDPFQDASRGILRGTRDNILHSTGSLAWDLGELKPGEHKTFSLYLAAGENEEQVRTLLAEACSKEGRLWLEKTKQFWQGWLEPGLRRVAEAGHSAFNRSLLTMKLLTNKETGASIAAPEFDPYYTACGGYGYCWPRDSVFITAALDEAGYHDLACQFYDFAAAIQYPDGSWRQRYFTDGTAAPFWGQQIDQVGSVLWGYGHHYNLTNDDGFIKSIWPSLEAGANYLATGVQENGLPTVSFDPWEDSYGQGTYSAAAVCGGLKASSDIARSIGEKEKSDYWLASSERVKNAILKHQWSARRNSFIRGVNHKVDQDHYNHILHTGGKAYVTEDPTGLYVTHWAGEDERIDAALLGLAFPFAVLDPSDIRITATVRAIEENLWNHDVGGIHRYEGDCYRGGNPWLITTLWLAIYYCTAGNRIRAEELYQWSLAQANQHLLLPEQADKHHGGPAWVLPLTWSHAMFVLTHLALNGGLSVLRTAKPGPVDK
ncbi:MAG: glycoside hydrolase family 15 protein [Desulfotomaculaceae bacterium]|nr:glycoside hydrolase family 15 protein [Desulfotomaculaceae bacterium]MDD4766470.1 glycoside hydrolase family 15 protein [Desulfotomaculaceae bacterium]